MSTSKQSSDEWISFFVRPDAAECLIDLMLPDGRVLVGVRYRDGGIVDEAEAQLDFCGWQYTRRNRAKGAIADFHLLRLTA